MVKVTEDEKDYGNGINYSKSPEERLGEDFAKRMKVKRQVDD